MQQQPQPLLISIEGDIGAGKSTLIKQLREAHPEWHFIDEPVNTWLEIKNELGENLLELFYKDQDTYAYTFQNCAVLSRARNIQNAVRQWQAECVEHPEAAAHNIFVTERCLQTDYNVFAKMMYDSGRMGVLEWTLYKMWYEFAQDNSYPLWGVIHVATPPDVCLSRIGTRGRKEEEGITLEYLQSLERYQNAWLNNGTVLVLKYVNYGEVERQTRNEDVEKFIDKLRFYFERAQ